MARKIILITGGQRSGKSEYAEQLALKLDPSPIYLATATIGDDEMRRRVEAHRARRGSQWINIEEPLHPSRHNLDGHTVLVDCLTLWSSNIFFESHEDIDESLRIFNEEFQQTTAADATFIFVTNEIGMGGISPNATQRRFTDLQGYVNRTIAQLADRVVIMISGIPIEIK